MKSLIIFLLVACLGSKVFAYPSASDQLDEKLRQTKIEIAKLHFREELPVPRKLYSVHWDRLWRENLNTVRPFIENTFDGVLLIDGSRVLTLPVDVSTSNQSALREVTLTRSDGLIKFTRSVVWKTVLYLLVCYETCTCSLYTAIDNTQLRHRQTVQHRGCPVDASFFVRANRLYLVVADNSGKFTVPSLIYHWRGTYMDVVAEVMTTGAVSVVTFKHKQSTIIVFAQKDRSVADIGSVVYEFKETSPDRIQFLSTSSPVSVHYYSHAGFNFIFLINERGPSNLFWWDGQELLNWQQISEIGALCLVHVFNVNNNTFFFISRDSTLQLYTFENASDCAFVSSRKLSDGETVIDVRARIDKSKLIAVLITVNKDNVYSVESWELCVEEMPSEHSTEESDVLSKHLSELVEMLQERKPLVEKAEASWPNLLPANEDLTILEPVLLPNIELKSGTVGNIDVFAAEGIIAPKQLQRNIENLIREVKDILAASKNLLTSNGTNSLTGDIVVDGDAFIKNLQIDSADVDFLNDVDIRVDGAINSYNSPELLPPFRGHNIIVQNLQVDSLCGIPFQYWAVGDDTSKVEINVDTNSISFSNDTLLLHSNFSMENLNVKLLNDIDVQEFLSELFIVGSNQTMKGNITFKDSVQIDNLTMQTLNGKSFENYMTAKTDQTLEQGLFKSIQIDRLYADKINGVPVSEAARVSQRNVVKGDVKIAKLQITERLTAEAGFKPTESSSLQIYFDVTINGSLTVKVLDLTKFTRIFLDGEQLDLNNIFDEYWTKSTDQIIGNDVAFENNVTIDHLNSKFLNGYTDQDFLYTTATVIPEKFTNLHFQNVHTDNMFVIGEEDSFFENAPESLTISDKLHLKRLNAKKLFTTSFNGLPVTDILNGNPIFPETMNFPTVRAKRVNVNDLKFSFLNDEDSVTFFENALNVPEDGQTDVTKIPELTAESVVVDRINDLEMEKILLLKNIKASDLKTIIIDGDLTVRNDLKIHRIDDQSPEIYLQNMVEEDIVIDSEESIDELVVQNATLRFLHDRDVNSLFDNVLSKTREQSISGQFSFYRINSDNMDSKFVNNQDTSKLTWIDESLLVTGNVTFDDLIVEGNVVTKTLNGRNISELHENLLTIPATRINNLEVRGNMFWKLSSTNLTSLSSLFEHAVTKDTDQIIRGDTVFENDVSVAILDVKRKEVDEIRDITIDAVMDDEKVIEVLGEKTFKETVTVDNLAVAGDVNVPQINDINILEFNDSVVRQDQDETISWPTIFLEEAAMNQVSVNDSNHDVPLDGLTLATDMLPSNVSFKYLVVLADVFLKNLDGVNFDEFLENRVTIDGNHEIDSDVQFNGVVEVTGNANVTSINGIDPSDLILDGIEETQIVTGMKSFESDVVIAGNIHASLVNGVDIVSEYSNGVQNDEDVTIAGDLMFESKVKVPENVSVSGLINEINLHSVLNELEEKRNERLQTFRQNETRMEESIKQSALISNTLKNIFSYLEIERNLKIQVPNIKSVNVVYYEGITKLNMFGEEAGSRCGLPDNCSCPTEYVAELTKDECRVWRTNSSAIVRNYHELYSIFGINVLSSTVSTSRECTSTEIQNEFTTISWMKSGMIETGDVLADVRETSTKIRGFVKDATVFMTYDNAAYVVLAIYYDAVEATHRADSLIFKINFETNRLSLHQKLSTDGAWTTEVFKTNRKDVYLLLGCFGDSEKSFLYKLDSTSSMFTILRSFRGKTRNVRSLIQEEDRFILLDDFDTKAVNIFLYDPEFDNFYDYQSLFHDSPVNSIENFYTNEFGSSDSFVVVTTNNDQFYIYEYMYAQKFRLKVHHQMDDLQAMVPFYYSGNRYIFTGTKENSTILRIVQQGPH